MVEDAPIFGRPQSCDAGVLHEHLDDQSKASKRLREARDARFGCEEEIDEMEVPLRSAFRIVLPRAWVPWRLGVVNARHEASASIERERGVRL